MPTAITALLMIELLEQQERWDEMLDQYIDLASAYQSMADFSNARTTYEQAVQLAQQNNAPTEKIIEIMHLLGAVDLERVELRGALRTYQQICEAVPDDVEVRRVDLSTELQILTFHLSSRPEGALGA